MFAAVDMRASASAKVHHPPGAGMRRRTPTASRFAGHGLVKDKAHKIVTLKRRSPTVNEIVGPLPLETAAHGHQMLHGQVLLAGIDVGDGRFGQPSWKPNLGLTIPEHVL